MKARTMKDYCKVVLQRQGFMPHVIEEVIKVEGVSGLSSQYPPTKAALMISLESVAEEIRDQEEWT